MGLKLQNERKKNLAVYEYPAISSGLFISLLRPPSVEKHCLQVALQLDTIVFTAARSNGAL